MIEDYLSVSEASKFVSSAEHVKSISLFFMLGYIEAMPCGGRECVSNCQQLRKGQMSIVVEVVTDQIVKRY